ncbi:pumilio-like protein 24, partial [Micractinium conductrix]
MGAAGNKRAAPTSSGAAAKRAKPGGAPPRPNTKHAGQGKPPAAKLEKLGRKERKELERARKMRRNKNFGLIEEVVALWEEARRHDVTPAKRSKLVAAILGKVQGHVAELAGSHSASRVIQTCAKYGTAEERASILRELEPKLLELSKSPYGHFVVSKLVALAPKQQLPGLLKAFRGHLGELLRHPAGSHVVDDLYAVADARQRNLMAAEFYGREYVLFESGTLNNSDGTPAHLSDLMSRVDGAKQRSIIQHMSKDLIPIMEKGLVDCPLVHRLVSEFMEFSPASVVADAADNLCGDPLLHMVHTKEGVKAVCMALAYGTAKDRKKALKCMKGHVDAMARDEWGHLALITALSVVDDTTLLRKTVIVDLQHEVEAAARQQEPAAEAGGGGGDDSDEEEGEAGANGRPTSGPLGVSKKDP